MRVSENTLHVFPRSEACCNIPCPLVRSTDKTETPSACIFYAPPPACSSHRGSTQQVDIHLFAPAPERRTQAGSRAPRSYLLRRL